MTRIALILGTTRPERSGERVARLEHEAADQ
jgi:hypothetical protein